MPTRTRVIVGSLVAALGLVVVVVGVLGTVLDWGAETKSEAVVDDGSAEPEPETQAPPDAETPEEFLSSLATAIQEGDVDFQVERLHPAVIDRYGEDACRAEVATRTDPTRAFTDPQVRAEPEDFDYASDGLSQIITDTVVVDAQVTIGGATEAQAVHIAEVDGEFRYFSDCGTPLTA
jgi:hypothetical protein